MSARKEKEKRDRENNMCDFVLFSRSMMTNEFPLSSQAVIFLFTVLGMFRVTRQVVARMSGGKNEDVI